MGSMIKGLFTELDADGSGSVDIHEFLGGLQEAGLTGLSASQLTGLHVDCDRDMDGQLTLDEFTSAIAAYYKEHDPGQFDAAVSAPKKKKRGLFGRRSTPKANATTTTDDAPYKEKDAKKTGLLGRMGKRRKAKAAMNFKAKGDDLSTAEFVAIMNAESDDEADPFVNALNGPARPDGQADEDDAFAFLAKEP